jgi:stage II sporulation protein D
MDVGGFLIRPFCSLLLCLWTASSFPAIPKPGAFPTWNATIEKPVRVRLAKEVDKVTLHGFGLSLQGQSEPFQTVGAPRLGSMQIERVETPQGEFWKIRKEEGDVVKVELKSAPVLVIDGRELRRGGQSLPSRLVLHAKVRRFDLIGVLPLENYLVGVLSSEMPLAWPMEALKAQAVAARSYTLAVMRERRSLHYDVETSILDQVFNHVSRELDSSPMIQKAKQAVADTKGVILIGEKGEVAKAYYHADCGGRTTPAKIVWGTGEKTPVVVDSFCPGHPRSKWTLSMDEEELRQKLSRRIALTAAIEKIFPLAPSSEDRAAALKLVLADGSEKMVNAHEFREAVGYSELRSTFFTVEKQNGLFLFQGRGWGHGVGLCQWGSRKLAETGQGAFEILKHYYPLSRLTGEIKGSPAIALRKTEPQE